MEEPAVALDLDRHLLRLAETDDEAEWAELLAAEGGFLRAVARDHLDGEDLVDDTVQEAVLRCRRALRSYRSYGEAEARGWLRGVVRHTALDLISAERSRRRRERTASEGTGRHEREHRRRRAIDADLEERMESSLGELPTKQRSVIDLHYFFGLSFGDIANRLRMTPNHVHVLHKRALGRLRQRLGAAGAQALSIAALTALLAARGEAVEVPLANAAAVAGDGASATSAATQTTGRLARTTSRARWEWLGGLAVSGAVVVIVLVALSSSADDGVIRRIELPRAVVSHPATMNLAFGSDSLWMGRSTRIRRLDPHTGALIPGDPLRVPFAPVDSLYRNEYRQHYYLRGTAWDDGSLWFYTQTMMRPDRLLRWDPSSGSIEQLFEWPEHRGCVGLAAGDGRLWSIQFRTRELICLDQADGRILGRAPLPERLKLVYRLAYVDGSVWLGERREDGQDMLVKIDPTTAAILERRTAPIEKIVSLCGGGPGRLWVVGADGFAYLVDVSGP